MEYIPPTNWQYIPPEETTTEEEDEFKEVEHDHGKTDSDKED